VFSPSNSALYRYRHRLSAANHHQGQLYHVRHQQFELQSWIERESLDEHVWQVGRRSEHDATHKSDVWCQDNCWSLSQFEEYILKSNCSNFWIWCSQSFSIIWQAFAYPSSQNPFMHTVGRLSQYPLPATNAASLHPILAVMGPDTLSSVSDLPTEMATMRLFREYMTMDWEMQADIRRRWVWSLHICETRSSWSLLYYLADLFWMVSLRWVVLPFPSMLFSSLCLEGVFC